METSLALGNINKPWGDMLYEEEQNRKQAYLRMPRAEWLACVNAYFNTLRGNGSALLSALSWFVQMEAEREQAQMPVAPVEVDEQTRNWRVWLDMVEEPEKYGSDIAEWIELDEELRRGPKRWRVDAYWNAKALEYKEAMAVKIQALWRGYQAREAVAERFNCGRCLKHVACFDRLTDDDLWVCSECKVEWDDLWRKLGDELEAEECSDCCDVTVMTAPIGRSWFCPECIHDWTECTRCNDAVRIGTHCENHCRNCGDSLENATTTLGYCSYDCQLEYQQDNVD